MKKGKFIYFRSSKNRQYYWRLVSSNGQPICQSEGYTTLSGVKKGIAAVKRIAASAEVISGLPAKKRRKTKKK